MTACAFAILALVVLKISDLRQLLFSVPNPISVQTSSGRQVALGTTPRPDSSVVERGPEKAGVGGSIPSLATTFSTTYKVIEQRLRSETFQPRGGVGQQARAIADGDRAGHSRAGPDPIGRFDPAKGRMAGSGTHPAVLYRHGILLESQSNASRSASTIVFR